MVKKLKQKRIEEGAEELAKSIQYHAEADNVSSKLDSELFVVDTVGSKSARRKITQEVAQRNEGKIIQSRGEKRVLEKLLTRKLKKAGENTAEGAYDMWNSSEELATKEAEKSSTRKKVRKIAVPGQSYNPSVGDHQDALAEAVALELQKREAKARDEQAWNGFIGSSATALMSSTAAIAGDEEDECSDDDDNSGEEGAGGFKVGRRRNQLKTKAKRNKMRNRSFLDHEELLKRRDASLLKSIESIPHVLRSMDKEEQTKEIQRQLRETKKAESADSTAMTYDEAGMVPLSDELSGSLRQVIPKGSRLKDKLANMVAAGDAEAHKRRKRRHFDKPHAGKNVKWVAKTKFSNL